MTDSYTLTEAWDVNYASQRVDDMRRRASGRDKRQTDVMAMRRGDYESIARGMLPQDFDRGLVANLIDTAAHDLSEVMAPLPTVACASSSQTSQKKKDFANKRALIANHYVQSSRLSDQMYVAADKYCSFGWFAYIVEPDLETKMPVIRIDKGNTAYFAQDYRDRVVQYVSLMQVPVEELCHMFPEHDFALRTFAGRRNSEIIEIAEWHDANAVALFVPEARIALSVAKNILGRPAVRIVGRPSLDGEKRGQFDDVIGVQVARAIIAQYTLSAVQQAVEAPIALPDDVQELELGPFSAITSKQPDKIGRVRLDIPPGVFPEQQALAMEQRVGSRYPEARSGNIDASIVTGQGVQALMGTFDTQIQSFQRLNASALEDVLADCFELDQKLWPNSEKSIRVKDSGSPVEITYRPSRDIDSDFSSDVSYGAIAGLDPNRALIFLLQATSGEMLSKETGRRFLPVDVDHVQEEKRMDLEAIRASQLAAVQAYAQAIPQIAASGGDVREIVMQIANITKLREGGKTIDQAITETLAPKQTEAPPQNPDMAALMAAQAGAGGGQAPPTGGPQIAPPASPGQDLLMGLAGISPSGQANLQSNLSTRQIAR